LVDIDSNVGLVLRCDRATTQEQVWESSIATAAICNKTVTILQV